MKNFLFKIASLAENRSANITPTKKADGYYGAYYIDGGDKGNSNDYHRFWSPTRHLAQYAYQGGLGKLIVDMWKKRRMQGR